MKKGCYYLITFMCIFFLSVCMVQETQNFKNEVYAEESADSLADKQTVLQQLSQLLQIVNEETYEHSVKEKASMDFIELLQSTLSAYDLTDRELSDLQLNAFVYEKQEFIQDDISLRFIVFMGRPEIFGTLERNWTFVEIYQGNKKYIQTIYEKTSETPTNCKKIQEDGRNYVLLYGGTTMYTPRPLFISFWELSNTELIPGNIINRTDCAEENVRVYENMLIFESVQDQWYFDEEMTDVVDNSLLSVMLGAETEIIIVKENGDFVAQKG